MFIIQKQYTDYAKQMEQLDKEIEIQAKQYNVLLQERKNAKDYVFDIKPKLRQLDSDIYVIQKDKKKEIYEIQKEE